jgi:hypothetical protein
VLEKSKHGMTTAAPRGGPGGMRNSEGRFQAHPKAQSFDTRMLVKTNSNFFVAFLESGRHIHGRQYAIIMPP